ncbi:MFS transporter [Sphaerisporangium krabiense]|uniref:MFS family permease n=1 Tax=Sphaerisporangium krabiense TaxID=763782 RepID=A0A7W8Z1M9_9ACTN|nr:MFS transporter [Sphaerisporangium krabiense]MBB5625784.1 MFS family permease [Sphaerisporangium krabiense]GII62880.1 MFS transporter [Sphaerisporangium krabiense]
MRSGHRLGRRFGWLWGAYATSALGTWLAFGAFPLIAIQVLHAEPAEVAALSSVGAAVGAAVAVPLGPWVEFRRKRPVLIGMDLARFAALLTIPAAFALGALSFVQLLLVSVVVAAADITFRAASGAYLKTLLPAEDLLVANARFESTSWTTTIIGPPLGGAAIGLLGPVVTVAADALSYLLSALGIRAMGGQEPPPQRREVPHMRAEGKKPSTTRGAARESSRMRPPGWSGSRAAPNAPSPRRCRRRGDLLDGWRYILADATLRPLFFNTALFNGLVMATDALLAVLMLGRLGFTPWQYGLAFAAPAIGGLFGSRLARPLVTRFGQHRVLVMSGTLRALWPVGLAFLGPGTGGLLLVMTVELGLIFCCAVFNPVYATYRLERSAPDRIARTLSAWAVTTKATTALLTAIWGVLGTLLGPRTAIALAGALLLATPLLLPRRTPAPLADPDPDPDSEPEPAQGALITHGEK